MSQLCLFIIIFYISLSSYASEDFVGVHLNKGETISDLLYTKLGLSPIYAPSRLLKDVLIFNKLDKAKAKSLKTGYEVKIPKRLLKATPEPEINPATPQVEKLPTEIFPEEITMPQMIFSHGKTLAVELGALTYSGNSQAQGKFNGVASFLGGNFVYRGISNQWHVRSLAKIDQTYIKSPNLNITATSYMLSLAAMRRANEKFDLGPGVGFKRDFFIIIDDNRKEKIQYAYLPTFFLAGQYAFSPLVVLRGDIGMNLPAQSDENLKISAKPYASFELSKNFNEEYFATINSLLGSRKIDDSEQMIVKFGLSVGREF